MKKLFSVLLTLLMMAGVIAVAPVMVHAAGPDTPGTCDVVSQLGNDATGVSFNDALAIAKLEADEAMVEIHLLDNVTITGNLTLEDLECIDLYMNGKTLTITGSLTIGIYTAFAFMGPGTCKIGSYTTSGWPLTCWEDGIITVSGNVTHIGTNGIGVRAVMNSKITIEGTITVPTGATYIHVEDTDKTQAQYETTSTYPYLTYSGTYDANTSYVYVKNAAAFKAVTVTGGTGDGNFLPGAAVAIVATVPAGKLFDKWTATGVTLTEAQKTGASTSFTMPNNAVTVTAAFKDANGIFGTKARWTGEWWHYLLFFLCFGFLWMWFI